jgi:hypothetical protein
VALTGDEQNQQGVATKLRRDRRWRDVHSSLSALPPISTRHTVFEPADVPASA